MAHSLTGVFVKALTDLSTYEHINPTMIPRIMELKPRAVNSPAIYRVDCKLRLSFSLEKLTTVLKRMIDTASFVIPSPKIKLKSFGWVLGLRRETAAITSVEQRREHMSRTSMSDNVSSDHS